jgi:hypothetical protein
MSRNTSSNTALLVSIASMFVSIASLIFSVYVFDQGRTEDLSVSASLSKGANLLRCTSFGSRELIIQTPASVLVANNSDRKISIIDYKVFQMVEPGRRRYYSRITSGIFNPEGSAISLPFSIEAGDSRRMEILLGVWAERKAAEEIRKRSLCQKTFSRRTLMQVLGKKGLDIYDNAVKLEYNGPSLIFYGPSTDAKEQEFELTFITGRGSRFRASTSWYPYNELLRQTF